MVHEDQDLCLIQAFLAALLDLECFVVLEVLAALVGLVNLDYHDNHLFHLFQVDQSYSNPLFVLDVHHILEDHDLL